MANEFDVRIAQVESRTSRLNSLLSFVFGGLLGVAGTVTASYFGYLNKDRELDLELAKLSLSILAGDFEDDQKYLPARRFALDALEKGTGVEIAEDDKESWAVSGVTPSSIDLGFAPMWGTSKFVGDKSDQPFAAFMTDHTAFLEKLFHPGIGQSICISGENGLVCGRVRSVDSIESTACVGEGEELECGTYASKPKLKSSTNDKSSD